MLERFLYAQNDAVQRSIYPIAFRRGPPAISLAAFAMYPRPQQAPQSRYCSSAFPFRVSDQAGRTFGVQQASRSRQVCLGLDERRPVVVPVCGDGASDTDALEIREDAIQK